MNTEPSTFWAALAAGLLEDSFAFHADNIDRVRFPKSRRTPLRDALQWVLARAGFFSRGFSLRAAQELLAEMAPHGAEYERAWSLLEDDDSRRLFLQLFRYRLLGPRHVKLPLNNPRYHADRRRAHAARRGQAGRRAGARTLDWYEWDSDGRHFRALLSPGAVQQTFLQRQYEYRGGTTVAVQPGDVVIDGGACWGDTALCFAQLAGEAGRVWCFEFEPSNLEVLRANLEANPELAPRVEIVPHALSDHSGDVLRYQSYGAGTRLTADAGTGETTTLTIDDLVASRGLAKVDFIKMDIEGSELSALRGAAATLRRDRPRLAICLYHSSEDFFRIPLYLAELIPSYRFHLAHQTYHAEETILFCV